MLIQPKSKISIGIFSVALIFTSVCFLVVLREIYLGIFAGVTMALLIEILRNTILYSLMWGGARVVFVFANYAIPWQKYPITGLIIQLIAAGIYSYAFVLFYAFILEGKVDDNIGSRDRHFMLMVIVFVLSTGFNLTLTLKKILDQWKSSMVTAEQANKAKITAELAVLRNQVNPHFLFNSLNTLSSLVYKDAELSDKYINQMAKVYRYLLDTKEKDLVKLEEELAFIDSFIYLLKIRFKEAIMINISVDLATWQASIIPNTLQLLIENAVKHNIILEKTPLIIDVFVENEFLVVKNSLRERRNKENSTNVGLKNITERYEFFCHCRIDVLKTENAFIVKIPLLYEG